MVLIWDIRLGQGRENAKQYLKENPSVALDIENQIREKYSLPLAKAVESTSVEKIQKSLLKANKKDKEILIFF